MPKANVLPEPVTALPTTSCPLKTSGMADAWMGVGCENPKRAIDDNVIGDRFRNCQADTTSFSDFPHIISYQAFYHQLHRPPHFQAVRRSFVQLLPCYEKNLSSSALAAFSSGWTAPIFEMPSSEAAQT